MTLAEVVAEVLAIPTRADGLIPRAKVLDILQGYAYALATEELTRVPDLGDVEMRAGRAPETTPRLHGRGW